MGAFEKESLWKGILVITIYLSPHDQTNHIKWPSMIREYFACRKKKIWKRAIYEISLFQNVLFLHVKYRLIMLGYSCYKDWPGIHLVYYFIMLILSIKFFVWEILFLFSFLLWDKLFWMNEPCVILSCSFESTWLILLWLSVGGHDSWEFIFFFCK